MNPQDRPARRFDEPPAYEDLELRPPLDDDIALFHGHHPACPWTIEGDWTKCRCGAVWRVTHPDIRVRRDPELARRSHLGAIVIVAAVVVLVVIAAALFVRGAS